MFVAKLRDFLCHLKLILPALKLASLTDKYEPTAGLEHHVRSHDYSAEFRVLHEFKKSCLYLINHVTIMCWTHKPINNAGIGYILVYYLPYELNCVLDTPFMITVCPLNFIFKWN